MRKALTVGSALLALGAGVGAAGIASAQSGQGAAGSRVTIWGNSFSPTLASSSELQVKDGSVILVVYLTKKGYDYWQMQSSVSGRISVTVPVGNGLPDVVLSSAFPIRAGQTKVTIPTTLAQRHAINVKGTGAQTGPSKRTASIAIEVERPGSDGSVTVYRYTKTGHITVLKRTASVSLADQGTDFAIECSPASCPDPFGTGSVVLVPLRCAGNPDDNQGCNGKVTVTVAVSGRPSVVWDGSYSLGAGELGSARMAIKTKGTGANNNRYAATIKITPTSGSGKKEFKGHVTLLK